jgi:DNA-binding PadR family transcriptional regulator
MQLQLDTLDIHLLKEIAELGDVSPKVFDQGHRLERLELEGYVSSVRQDAPGLDSAPAWVYRLTLKGRAAASRR